MIALSQVLSSAQTNSLVFLETLTDLSALLAHQSGAMEARRNLPRTASLSSRNIKMTREALNFRKAARQVMLANMFTRMRPKAQSLTCAKMAAGDERRVGNKTERKRTSSVEEKPPLKRRGTPELFPMSEEMRQTVISLGKLDLLPEEGEKYRASGTILVKTRAGNKFRDKTRKRIIHPQRFIRNVQSSMDNSQKIILENDVHYEKLNEEDNDCKESREDKEKCFSNELSDGVCVNTKTNCKVLSRESSTHFHSEAKSAKGQYFPLIRRPLYATRCSDLRAISTRPTVRLRRIRSQGTWPTVSVISDARISSTGTQRSRRNGRDTVKAWAEGSEISRSTEESDKNSNETAITRRWKSVESLTREIEEKCLSWLENRHGMIQGR